MSAILTPLLLNASFNNFQSLWNDGIGALFGSNLILVGGFFALFGLYVGSKLDLSSEVMLPFISIFLFILTIMNPGLLPGWVWSAVLVLGAIIIARAIAKHTGY